MVKIILNIIESIIQSLKFIKVKNLISKEKEKQFKNKPKKNISKKIERDINKLDNKKYFEKIILENDECENEDIGKFKEKKKTSSKALTNKEKEDSLENIEEFEIREEPDSKSEKIGTIKKGDNYKELKSVPHWLKISFEGKKGYLSKIAANKMKS